MINGNARFTALMDGEIKGSYILAFFEKQEDIGDLSKSAGCIGFANWHAYEKFITFQFHLVRRLSPQKNIGNQLLGKFSNN